MSNRANEDDSGNSLKFEKSTTRISQRGSNMNIRNYERLSGGADAKSKSSASVNKFGVDTNKKVSSVVSETLEIAQEAEKITTGEKSVNEMIDYVIQNLQEAGKALASLGENFEHDIKLMFVDVMGKVQNWVSLAQIRLDAARTDLSSLRRELISRSNELVSRDREIADLKTKLTESETTRSAYEKAMSERTGGPIQSPSTMTFVPSRQPMPPGVTSVQSGNIVPQDLEALSDPQTGLPSGQPIAAETLSSQGILSGVTASGAAVQQSYRTFGTTQDELAYGLSQQAAVIPGVGALGRPGDPAIQARQYREADGLSTADVAVQSGKNRERTDSRLARVSELESELSRLRKENEKIMKERTEYENAIQRALLRGVSSLNAETLRVLRCSPVTCYTPCGPPPSPVNTVEAMIPCNPKKTRDNWTPRGCRTTNNSPPLRISSSNRAKLNGGAALPAQEGNCCGVNKRPSAAAYGSFSRCKKSPVTSDPSMVFLLHQADSSRIGVSGNGPQVRSCDDLFTSSGSHS